MPRAKAKTYWVVIDDSDAWTADLCKARWIAREVLQDNRGQMADGKWRIARVRLTELRPGRGGR